MKQLIRFYACGLFIFSFLIFSNGFALEVDKREPVIVTATRVDIPQKNVTQSYTVINAEDITLRQENNVTEVLREVPGMVIIRNGTQGANTTAFLRGANSSQSLVMIDGIEVNTPTVGSFDFGNFVTDNIDRVEIIRGPQSALYGSEAMGGVVNVITKRGEGETKLTLEGEGGSDDTGRGFVAASGAKGPLDFALSSSYLSTSGEFVNDGYENYQSSVNAGLALMDGLRVEFITRYSGSLKEIQDFGVITPDPNRFNRDEWSLAALRVDHWIAEWWQHVLTLSFTHDRFLDNDPLNPGETGSPLLTKITNEIRTVHWQNNFFWNELQTITLGLEYQDTDGKNVTTGDLINGNFSFDENPHNFAAYIQDQVNLGDRLIIVPGLRVDDPSFFNTKVSPKVSGAFWILPQTKLRASWGEGFRAPSINELVFPAFGNRALEAEESTGWEAGVEQTFLNQKIGFNAAYFRNDFDNLIDFEIISQDPFIGRANNISKARTEGVELSSFVKPCECFTLKGSWTHLNAENEITGETLPRRPDNTGVLEGILKWQKFTFVAATTLVSSRPDFGQTLAGYIKIDVALSYQLNEHWMPYVRINNMLDDQYEEAVGFPAPGILAYAGIKGEF